MLACLAGLTPSGRTLLERFTAPAVLILEDGSQLRLVTGLSLLLVDTLAVLALPPAGRYLAVHA